jgi:hypothetical protein
MSRHHVKRHHWINGVLHTYENAFESLFEAKEFAENSIGDTIKVYNDTGECVHEVASGSQDTYA